MTTSSPRHACASDSHFGKTGRFCGPRLARKASTDESRILLIAEMSEHSAEGVGQGRSVVPSFLPVPSHPLSLSCLSSHIWEGLREGVWRRRLLHENPPPTFLLKRHFAFSHYGKEEGAVSGTMMCGRGGRWLIGRPAGPPLHGWNIMQTGRFAHTQFAVRLLQKRRGLHFGCGIPLRQSHLPMREVPIHKLPAPCSRGAERRRRISPFSFSKL